MLKKVIFSMLLYTSMICPALVYAANSVSNSGNGCPTNPIGVPFSNFTLNKNCSVYANYSFGSNKFLFCYAGAANTAGILYWKSSGQSRSGKMPIVLTTSLGQEGSADNPGTLQVINNTNGSISVNCVYAFM
jgi:hypothetical protein